MNASKFTDEQITFALKQAALGTSVEKACREMGISDSTLYVRRKETAVSASSLPRRSRRLEEENHELKHTVVGRSLDNPRTNNARLKSSSPATGRQRGRTRGRRRERARWRSSAA